MPTRRDILIGSIAAGAILRSRIGFARASQPATPVNFDVPAGACDCHTHIHGDPVKFPYFEGRENAHQGELRAAGEHHQAEKAGLPHVEPRRDRQGAERDPVGGSGDSDGYSRTCGRAGLAGGGLTHGAGMSISTESIGTESILRE